MYDSKFIARGISIALAQIFTEMKKSVVYMLKSGPKHYFCGRGLSGFLLGKISAIFADLGKLDLFQCQEKKNKFMYPIR